VRGGGNSRRDPRQEHGQVTWGMLGTAHRGGKVMQSFPPAGGNARLAEPIAGTLEEHI